MEDRYQFRVYYKPHKKIYNVICLNSLRQKEIIIEYKGSSAIVEWDNCIILQSTGMKDRNNNLIFEGDIVKVTHISPSGEKIECIGKVYFDRCMYWIDCKHCGIVLYREEDTTYEIIGNIHKD